MESSSGAPGHNNSHWQAHGEFVTLVRLEICMVRLFLHLLVVAVPFYAHTSILAQEDVPMKAQWSCCPHLQPIDQERGRQAVQEGRVAVVLLAGGQGSRLGRPCPKGCFPVTALRQASLFQCFAERLLAAQTALGGTAPLCVWTNTEHQAEVEQFWRDQHYFGLNEAQVTFVAQPERSILDEQFCPVRNQAGQVITAPDGNGSLWRHLEHTGLLKTWDAQGVRSIHVVPIDNVFAEPLELTAFGVLEGGNVQAVLLSIPRQHPTERVGVLLPDELCIAEYIELPAKAQGDEGCRSYPEAFSGLQTWSLAFARACAAREMPIHRARKNVVVDGTSRAVWKEEFFLFDLLSGEPSVGYMPVAREARFAPLKSLDGPDGLVDVQAAMERRARQQATQRGIPESALVRECTASVEWAALGMAVVLSPEGLLDVLRSGEDSTRQQETMVVSGGAL